MKNTQIEKRETRNAKRFIVFIASFVFLLSSHIFSQFNFIHTGVDTISASDSTFTVDSKGYKLAAVIMPSTVTADTFTVLTSATNVDSLYKVVNYENANLIVVGADGKQCGVSPDKVNQLLRYIRFRGNIKEAAKRTMYVVFTNF
jgi:hypothetical protein